MEIETYFGFFATSVFTAFGASLAAQTGQAVRLEGVSLGTTNGFKLVHGEVETLLAPRFAEPLEPGFLLALSAADTAGLKALGGGRVTLNRLVEQAAACAVEPFHFIAKQRPRLQGLRFLRNAPGLAGRHLGPAASYTVAQGAFVPERGRPFSLRLLVTPAGRDLVEERAGQPHAQRALFSINEGAYACRPQWEPPPAAEGEREGTGLSQARFDHWVQTFFALNDGALPPKVFKQPALFTSRLVPPDLLKEVEPGPGGVAVARLLLHGHAARGIIVVVPAPAEKSLLTLSKSGEPRFLGEFFRAFFGEAARLWQAFSGGPEEGAPFAWRLKALGRVAPEGLGRLGERAAGGGMVLEQEVRLDEGRVRWLVVVAPQTWRAFLLATARAMGLEAGDAPKREAVFAATGWGGEDAWGRLVGFCSDRDLQELIRLLSQRGIGEPELAAVMETLDDAPRERWLAAMPVMLRERTEGLQREEGEPPPPLAPLARALVELRRAGKLPPGRLAHWTALLGEMHWAARQELLDGNLPLRHLIYGMERGSLSRLLFDEKNDVLADLLCAAEFPVVDQVRRAISPGYAVRLLEDIAIKRPRTTAWQCQQAQVAFYRRCYHGGLEGRYLLRTTVGDRLAAVCRGLDQLDGIPAPEGEAAEG